MKATGAGLLVAPTDVVVSPADEPPRLISYRGAPLVAQIFDLDIGAGYAGALTILTDQKVSCEVLAGNTLLVPERAQSETVRS